MDLNTAFCGGDFSAEERSYVRRELDLVFSTLPTVAEGLRLKVWVTGPSKGLPKVPPPGRSLVNRGLAEIDDGQRPPRLIFTEGGLQALRTMMANPRLADPARFAHVRRELGIDPE